MENENKQNEHQSSDDDSTLVGTSIGRKFDVGTPEGRKDLETYLSSLSKVAGKNAQENDKLKRTLAKVQTVAPEADKDLLAIVQDENASAVEKALALKLLRQDEAKYQETQVQSQERFYAQATEHVKASFPDISLDDETIDALLRKHTVRFAQAEDPDLEVEKVFGKYGKQEKSVPESESASDHISFGSSGTSSGNKSRKITTSPTASEDEVLAAMGFIKK